MRNEQAPIDLRVYSNRGSEAQEGRFASSGRAQAGSVEPPVIGGISFDPITLSEAVDHIGAALERGQGGVVVTPNLDIVRQASRSDDVRRIVAGADLRIADGMTIVWASRLQRTPLPERVTGVDLSIELCARAAQRGRSIFLLGGNDGVAERAASRLVQMFPGLRIAGTYCPPFGFESMPDQWQRMQDAVAQARPDIVLVGIGFPKQERVIAQLQSSCPRAWWLGVGITLSFMAGEVVRAPLNWQQNGFEWLWRFFQEPRRLARRYFRDGLPFGLLLLARSGGKGVTKSLSRAGRV